MSEPVYRPNIEPEHANHYLACPRYPVAKLLHILPGKFLTQLRDNPSPYMRACCRDVLKHDIEAWYSSADVRDGRTKDNGCPDIYVVYCNTCDAEHRRFCVGGSHRPPLSKARGSSRDETPEEYAAMLEESKRPFWEVR